MAVSDLLWQLGSNEVRWRSAERYIIKKYRLPIESAVELKDESGVAVVENYKEVGPCNAVIYSEDGAERFRLELPKIDRYRETLFFTQMYYVGDELTAFAATDSADYGVVVNPDTGAVERIYYTR